MIELSTAEARRVLLATVGPCATQADSADGLLATLGMVQLDPLDRIGTNADLVAMARTPLHKGEIYAARAFEHVAKERCLLPPSAFPYYREEAPRRPHWRCTKAMKQVPAAVADAVHDEIRERGPLISRELSDHGTLAKRGKPGGWQSSGKLGTLALRVLTTQCRVIVSGRRGKERIYDLPERVLPEVADAPPEHAFDDWALGERVRAAGLLPVNAGPWWGALEDRRKGSHDGFETVHIAGRRYLTSSDALTADPKLDDRVRILGPLDPLIWSRRLVQDIFDFTYLWEVYKPAATRRWGYYVCPLLKGERLIGRVEARVGSDGGIVVDQVWWEDAADQAGLDEALQRHEVQLRPRPTGPT